jgi:hypothetical protein
MEGDATAMLLSTPSFQLFADLRHEFQEDPNLRALVANVQAGTKGDQWRAVDGLITVKGKIYVPSGSQLRPGLLSNVHEAKHEGTEKTLHRFRSDFYSLGARTPVRDLVRSCNTCQRNKSEHLHPAGLLQPLEIPMTVWANLAMDFIEGFPRVNDKLVILTIVDRFSKSAHFLPLEHPYIATSVACVFFVNIVKLHGVLSSIVSNCDQVFTAHFWQELFTLVGVKMQLSSTFHPQTDGQVEVTNKVITMYLRCLVGDRPRDWLKWLPWAEFCYDSSFQASIKTSPFRLVYGQDPPSLHAYSPGEARLPAVKHS